MIDKSSMRLVVHRAFGDVRERFAEVDVLVQLFLNEFCDRSSQRSNFINGTIRIDDVDAVCVELNARGVTLLNGPMNRPWGVRTASFADPGGHIWEIAQQLTE